MRHLCWKDSRAKVSKLSRVIFSTIKRNRIIEKIIVECDFKVSCIHTKRGCTHTEKNSMIKEHETNCKSRPVKCLLISGEQSMHLDRFLDHYKQNHKSFQMLEISGPVIFFNVSVKEEHIVIMQGT
jgi:hypothetical protein